MASKKASAEEQKQEVAVVNQGSTAVAEPVPDFLQGYQGATGTENMDAGDASIPRLKLAQSMTPEVKDGLAADGDIVHSITKQIIVPKGHAGIVIPVAYQKEFILWRDRQFDGGGILARAHRTVMPDGSIRYKWDKPNESFENKIKNVQKVVWKTKEYIDQDGLDKFGSSISEDPESVPAATAHYNYIVALPAFDYTIAAISFARTSAKAAKDWNAMLKMGRVPMFGRQFNIGAVQQVNENGDKYFVFAITPAGFVTSRGAFEFCKKMNIEFANHAATVDWSDEANDENGRMRDVDGSKEAF